MNGTLPPGGRLKEKELCELTGVSRTPVREAARVLEAQGLIINVPGEGPQVAVLSADEARQLYAVRAVLEAFAARQFATNASDGDIAELAHLVNRMRLAYEAGDNVSATEYVDRFYDLLLTGGGIPMLKELIDPLYARAGLLRQVSLKQDGRRLASIKELERVVKAIQKRDADAAAVASEKHVAGAERSAMTVLNSGALTAEAVTA